MVSVTSDIPASTAVQTMAARSTRPEPAQRTNSFAALVDAAIPASDSSSSSNTPAPSSPPRSSTSSSSASRDSSHSSSADASGSRAANDSTTGPAAADRSNDPGQNDKPAKSDDKSTTAAPSKTASDDGKSADKTGKDSSTKDDASAQAADPAAVPATPVAVAVQPTLSLDNAPGPQAATDSTGTAAAQAGALPGAADAKAGLLAAATKAASGTASSGTNDTTAGTATDANSGAADAAQPKTTGAFATVLDAAATGTGKSASKPDAAQAKVTGLNGEPTNTANPATATGQAPLPQSGESAQQPTSVDKTALPAAEPAKANGNGAAAAAHDPAGTQVNAQPTAITDPGSQMAGAFQPQLAATPTTAPISSANLTATAATSTTVPLHGVAVEIAASALNGKSHFELRLDPAELGRIDVRIDVDKNGQVTSHLRVEKPETLSMLQQTAPQLQQALADAGLKTGSSGLQFSLRDQNSSGQNTNDNQPNGNAQRLIVTEDETVKAQAVGRPYGRMLGAQGGVDIRV